MREDSTPTSLHEFENGDLEEPTKEEISKVLGTKIFSVKIEKNGQARLFGSNLEDNHPPLEEDLLLSNGQSFYDPDIVGEKLSKIYRKIYLSDKFKIDVSVIDDNLHIKVSNIED